RNASNVPRQSSAFARHESELQILPTQNIFVILPCRALTLGLRSPEPTRFASLSRNLPWPNGKFVASHSEYAYFGARAYSDHKNKTPHKVVWKTLLQPSYLRSKTRKDANEYRKRSYQGTSAQSLSAHWWLCRARPDGGQGARNSKWDSGRVPLQLSTRQHA